MYLLNLFLLGSEWCQARTSLLVSLSSWRWSPGHRWVLQVGFKLGCSPIHIHIWWASDLITRALVCFSEPHYVQKRYWPSLTQGCCFGHVPPASQRVTEVKSLTSASLPSFWLIPFWMLLWCHRYLTRCGLSWLSCRYVQSLRPCVRTPIPSWLWSCWRTAKWQLLGDWRGWSSLRILSTSWPSSWRQTRHISCQNG